MPGHDDWWASRAIPDPCPSPARSVQNRSPSCSATSFPTPTPSRALRRVSWSRAGRRSRGPTLPVMPAAAADTDVADSTNEQGAASCLTVTVWPAIVMVPERSAPVLASASTPRHRQSHGNGPATNSHGALRRLRSTGSSSASRRMSVRLRPIQKLLCGSYATFRD